MDTIIGVIVLFGIMLLVVWFIYRSIDQKYPKVKIQARFRGTRKIQTYRLRGTSIILNNLQAILMNNFVYCGDIRYLNYELQPNGQRIYDAIIRYDYLVGLDYKDKSTKELLDTRPTIVLPRKSILSPKGTTIKFNDFIFNPLTIEYTNEKMTEKTITSGKDVATRFIEADRVTSEFIKSSNPVMAVLITSIPLLIIGALFLLAIYVTISGVSDMIPKLMEISSAQTSTAAMLAEQNAKILAQNAEIINALHGVNQTVVR